MKQATLALSLAGTFILGGFATAHSFSSGAPSDFATVTLYGEDPAVFSNVLAVAEMEGGPIAKRLIDTDDEDELARLERTSADFSVQAAQRN